MARDGVVARGWMFRLDSAKQGARFETLEVVSSVSRARGYGLKACESLEGYSLKYNA